MTDRTPPHDETAEKALLGAVLTSNQALRSSSRLVLSSDFYGPLRGHAWQACLDLDAGGEKVDPVTVAALLAKRGFDLSAADLSKLAIEAPSISNAAHYARIVAEHSATRSLIRRLDDLRGQAYQGVNPAELIDHAKAALEEVTLPADDTLPDGVWSLDDWAGRESERAPWVIPGLLREQHRLVIVAPEGFGKSWISTQMAVCAGQGVHPFTFDPIPAVPSLVVDAENPEDSLDERAERMLGAARRSRGENYRHHMTWLWTRPGGLDLRSRQHLGQLEAILRQHRPKLVVLGPRYKLFPPKQQENHAEAAYAAQRVMDDLRTRYNFALVLEDHAPHAQGLSGRDLRPRDAQAWMGWPEFGFGLQPNEDGGCRVGRFRGDRVKAHWPDELHRQATGWPWAGYYSKGMR